MEGDTHGVVPRVNDVLLPAIRVLIGEDVFVLIFYMILLEYSDVFLLEGFLAMMLFLVLDVSLDSFLGGLTD